MVPPSQSILESLRSPGVLVGIVLGAEALAIVLALAPDTGDRWVMFGLWSLLLQWIALGSCGVLYAFRQPLGRVRPLSLGAIALCVLALVGATAGWAAGVLSTAGDADVTPLPYRVMGIVLAVGSIGMATLLNHWRARQLAMQVKQAELDALHARVRPHFLFNTLNTAASLVRQRPTAAEGALLDLADLFRAALSPAREVPLVEELTLCRQYLAIEQLRFGDRLRVRWDVPDPVPEVSVPPLSLQPLLENAVHHGVEPALETSTISVLVQATPEGVRVEVRNPVHGARAVPGHGIGLQAARSRVASFAGDRSGLTTTQADGEFLATMQISKSAHRL